MTSGYVRPERVNKWPNSMTYNNDDDDDDGSGGGGDSCAQVTYQRRGKCRELRKLNLFVVHACEKYCCSREYTYT